jgi:hypothetical protein
MSAAAPAAALRRADPTRTAAIRSTVSAVIVEAVRSAGASGVVVLDDWTPEGELTYEWLVAALDETRVWRGASLASNVHGVELDRADAQALAISRFVRLQGGLIAHPSSKTVLLLGGPLPRADLFPLGDLYASQVAQLAGGWSMPEELAGIVTRAGGMNALDAALARLVDGREAAPTALAGLAGDVADEVMRLYGRGRYHRRRPWLVPKLGARTLGVDLFD